MGSGTTALACLRRGVRFVGMEIDPVHFETALQRLRNEPANHQLTSSKGDGSNDR